MKTVKFDCVEDYENYLSEIFPYIEQDREYNIFMHCVTIRSEYFLNREKNPKDELKKRVDSIMSEGLNLEGTQGYGSYGSINGTAKFFGNSKDVDVEQISKYDYFSRSDTVNSIIIAIPKYIDVYGRKVEFSSFGGTMKHASQHIKDCLFDIAKDTYLPVEFILAHQEVNLKTGEVVLNINEKHLSNLSPDESDKFLRTITKKCEKAIERCKSKYGVEDFEDMFECLTDEHMIAIDDYLNAP